MKLLQTKVTVTIEARHGEDVPVAPFIAAAMAEMLKRKPDTREGTFETRDGLDVSWNVEHAYVEAPDDANLVVTQ